jgi:hypothetical protein
MFIFNYLRNLSRFFLYDSLQFLKSRLAPLLAGAILDPEPFPATDPQGA